MVGTTYLLYSLRDLPAKPRRNCSEGLDWATVQQVYLRTYVDVFLRAAFRPFFSKKKIWRQSKVCFYRRSGLCPKLLRCILIYLIQVVALGGTYLKEEEKKKHFIFDLSNLEFK